jgi:hypothetical protein
MVSPLADFAYLATDLSSTGTQNQAHFGRLSRLWGQTFYGLGRQGPQGQDSGYRTKKIEELRAKDPTADAWNTPVDMSDAPRFRYMEEGLGGRFRAALPPFAVLLGYGIVLFAAAYVAFIRYDVR